MIVVCENCHHSIFPPVDGAYWQHHGPRGGTSNATSYCSEKDPRLPGSAIATFGIQAWETEEPTLVIEGTQDRAIALRIATKLYMDLNGELPENLVEAIEDAAPVWINRDHPAYESESWPPGVTSPEERDGDTPSLWYSW